MRANEITENKETTRVKNENHDKYANNKKVQECYRKLQKGKKSTERKEPQMITA